MSSTVNSNLNKSAIIYCRISRTPDYIFGSGVMSLDSQESAIATFICGMGIRVFAILKNVGSAFSKPQT